MISEVSNDLLSNSSTDPDVPTELLAAQNLTSGWNSSDWRGFVDVVKNFKEGFFMYRDPLTAVTIAAYGAVFLLSLLGNLLVLVVFRAKRSMRSVTNYFLLNLAIADLLVAVVCVPLTVCELIYRVWIYGEFLCKASGYLQGVSICASVLTIMFLSLERYVAIRHPVRSRRLFTVCHVIGVIGVIWCVSAAIMVPLAVIRRLHHVTLSDGELLSMCIEDWPPRHSRRIFDVLLFIFTYAVPGTVVTCCYLSTGRRLLYRDKSLGHQDTQHKLMAGRRRIAWMLVLVAILFALSWLPYHTVSLYVDFVRRSEQGASLAALPFTLLLGHSHSAQNPILYWVMNRPFRRGVEAVMRCRRPDMTSELNNQYNFDRQDSRLHSSDRRSQRGSKRSIQQRATPLGPEEDCRI